MIPLSSVVAVILCSWLGACLGFWLSQRLNVLFPPRHSGRADPAGFGGLPVWLGTMVFLPWSGLPMSPEMWAVIGVLTGLMILGWLFDRGKMAFSVVLPYLLLLLIIGAVAGLQVHAGNHWVGLLLSVLWPLGIILCLKAASVIEEMPLLLCLISGLTFLLFFPAQAATPAWAIMLTLDLVTIAAFCLLIRVHWRKSVLGNSGLLPLAWLLAASSLLGRSKSLLMFGLLIPSMLVLFPVALICLLLLSSFIGNELYQLRAREVSSYQWSLSRERLMIFAGLVFLGLNFLGLLWVSQADNLGYVALSFLFAGSLIGFWQTFARRSPVKAPDLGSRITILNTPIDVFTPEAVLERLAETVALRDRLFHVVTADSLAVMRARRDGAFAGVVARANLVIPDGAGLIWGADFLGMPLPSRIPGIGLVTEICRQASKRGWRIYFLGSKPGVAEKAVKQLLTEYSDVPVAGIHHGFFQEGSEEEEKVISEIREKKPDILLVAMGVPRQEFFINRLRSAIPPCVAIGVGGSFDVISGSLPRAPLLMQRFALEWLFRLYKEPKRLRRMLAIPAFVFAVIREKLREQESQ